MAQKTRFLPLNDINQIGANDTDFYKKTFTRPTDGRAFHFDNYPDLRTADLVWNPEQPDVIKVLVNSERRQPIAPVLKPEGAKSNVVKSKAKTRGIKSRKSA